MESEQKKAIESVRQRIDSIDNTILNLLKERLDCAKNIGKLNIRRYVPDKLTTFSMRCRSRPDSAI